MDQVTKPKSVAIAVVVVVVVWVEPQVEVVADEEGGGGLSSGQHPFVGDGFCWKKLWFTEK